MLQRAERLQPHLNFLVLLDASGALRRGPRIGRALAPARAVVAARWRADLDQGHHDGEGLADALGSHATDETPAAEDAPIVARLRAAGMAIIGKSTTPEFGWKALTDSPLQGTTRSPWNPGHSPGGSSGGASSMTASGVGPFNHGNDGGGSIRIPAAHTGLVGLKPSLRPHPAISGRFAVRRRDQPGRAGAQRARHGAGAERHRRARSARLALAAGRGPRLHDRPRRAACAAGASASASTSVMSRPIPRCARWSRRRRRRFEALGAHVEDVGPLIEPLQKSFEPLWIGSFGVRLRQIPTQLHAKLDPGFRAAAEQGLSITLADYARAYEAKSKLARDMALWHQTYDLLLAPVTPTAAPPVETLYNSDAFPRWTKGAPYTLPFNLTGQPAASMPAGLTAAGCRSACRSSDRRAPIIACCRRCGPTKARAAGPGRSRKSWRAGWRRCDFGPCAGVGGS